MFTKYICAHTQSIPLKYTFSKPYIKCKSILSHILPRTRADEGTKMDRSTTELSTTLLEKNHERNISVHSSTNRIQDTKMSR